MARQNIFQHKKLLKLKLNKIASLLAQPFANNDI